jgi:hypothetical protein
VTEETDWQVGTNERRAQAVMCALLESGCIPTLFASASDLPGMP